MPLALSRKAMASALEEASGTRRARNSGGPRELILRFSRLFLGATGSASAESIINDQASRLATGESPAAPVNCCGGKPSTVQLAPNHSTVLSRPIVNPSFLHTRPKTFFRCFCATTSAIPEPAVYKSTVHILGLPALGCRSTRRVPTLNPEP